MKLIGSHGTGKYWHIVFSYENLDIIINDGDSGIVHMIDHLMTEKRRLEEKCERIIKKGIFRFDDLETDIDNGIETFIHWRYSSAIGVLRSLDHDIIRRHVRLVRAPAFTMNISYGKDGVRDLDASRYADIPYANDIDVIKRLFGATGIYAAFEYNMFKNISELTAVLFHGTRLPDFDPRTGTLSRQVALTYRGGNTLVSAPDTMWRKAFLA